jgi:hypothetical protein
MGGAEAGGSASVGDRARTGCCRWTSTSSSTCMSATARSLALLAALPEATAITLTWRLFGNAGVVEYRDLPVTETFTRAAPHVLHWPWRANLFKTLVRNDGRYRSLGVHRPRRPTEGGATGPRWFDGSGRELPEIFRQKRIFSNLNQDNHALVQLNHYPLGAVESFLLKRDRGRAVHADAGLDAGYWVERNFDAEEDRSILKLESGTLRDALHQDPRLASVARSCCRLASQALPRPDARGCLAQLLRSAADGRSDKGPDQGRGRVDLEAAHRAPALTSHLVAKECNPGVKVRAFVSDDCLSRLY